MQATRHSQNRGLRIQLRHALSRTNALQEPIDTTERPKRPKDQSDTFGFYCSKRISPCWSIGLSVHRWLYTEDCGSGSTPLRRSTVLLGRTEAVRLGVAGMRVLFPKWTGGASGIGRRHRAGTAPYQRRDLVNHGLRPFKPTIGRTPI